MDAYEIIIGNICSLCAMVSDSISGTRKNRNQILGIQILSQFFYAAGSIILKGYSSTAQNVVAVLRNLAALKNIKSKVIEWTLIVLGVALGILFNNRDLVGWLPIVANLEYSLAIFRFQNERGIKIALIINMLMFTVFSGFINNYVGIIANTVVAVTTAASLIKEKKKAAGAAASEADGKES